MQTKPKDTLTLVATARAWRLVERLDRVHYGDRDHRKKVVEEFATTLRLLDNEEQGNFCYWAARAVTKSRLYGNPEPFADMFNELYYTLHPKEPRCLPAREIKRLSVV